MTTTGSFVVRLRKWAIVVGAALVAIGIAWSVGYFMGAAGVGAAEDRAAAAEERVAVLEARQQLELALDALDARNFGIAGQRLRAASEHLARAGEDREELSEQAAAAAQARVDSPADLERQKNDLRALLERLDGTAPAP